VLPLPSPVPDRGGVAAVVVAGSAEALRRSHPELPVEVAAPDGLVAAANRVWDERRCHVVVIAEAVELPDRALDPAIALAGADPRVGTVSFLGDGFPAPASDDAAAVTRTLRVTGPALRPSPVPFAAGPAVLVSSSAFSAVGPLAGAGAAEALVDFSLRGRRRGFISLLDPSTFCRRLSGTPFVPAGEPEATLLQEYAEPGSPLSIVLAAARAKVCGLRVLIDAARLSPQEMGTQVATVALIRALARRADVARVCVALSGELPPYAASLRDDPKVDARVCPGRDFSAFGRVDVAHRPFQPDSPSDMDACRAVADRTVISILDLIAYHAVSYQLAPEHWRTYRDWLRQSVAQVDGVVAISRDVREQILLERLPVEPARVLVAELGTDHLTGEEADAVPDAVPAGIGPFVAVLGADYTHKNRDLAVRAHRRLCEQGLDLPLVMAGTPVHGSSRELEAEARAGDQRVVVLPDVSSGERNWLLRHAAVVLYPTSGEGFGLVPFEAARFGTPTAFVSFGPLAELAGELPVQAEDWSPAALAGAAAHLLADPDLARAQVEATLAAGDRYTWDRTAAVLAEAYRGLLARPPANRPPAAGEGDGSELEALRQRYEALRAEHEQVRQSVPLTVATRAGELKDALRRRLAGRDGP
jgi:glycosyltransferase involved in cell wall biosynthesis